MTPGDAARLLAYLALVDGRTVDEPTARAWADALDDIGPDAGMAAARAHVRGSTEWCKPAHIREQARLVVVARRPDRAVIGIDTPVPGTDLDRLRRQRSDALASDRDRRTHRLAGRWLTAVPALPASPSADVRAELDAIRSRTRIAAGTGTDHRDQEAQA